MNSNIFVISMWSCERFEPRSHFKSRLSLIVRVNVVLNRTVVFDSDWCFNNLCGSHLQSQSVLYRVSWWYYSLVIDLIGQLRRDVIVKWLLKCDCAGAWLTALSITYSFKFLTAPYLCFSVIVPIWKSSHKPTKFISCFLATSNNEGWSSSTIPTERKSKWNRWFLLNMGMTAKVKVISEYSYFEKGCREKCARDNSERKYGMWSIYCSSHCSCRTYFFVFL